jgi:hypothetical protein
MWLVKEVQQLNDTRRDKTIFEKTDTRWDITTNIHSSIT